MTPLGPFLIDVYSLTSGILTAWDVEVDQQVAAHDIVGTVTDKQGTAVPIISFYSGRVASLLKAPGEEVYLPIPVLLLADARDAQGRDMSKGGPFHWHLMRWIGADEKRSGGWGREPISHIARGLNISDRNMIWDWTSGGAHPTEEQLVALAALFGVSEEELGAAREALATFPPTSSQLSARE
ncbi:MAG: hypothetical protein H0T73_12990 [Ardenticatenales bacterium]|nr:hypothetical protein [Ardenticatenales bacterium]